MGFSGDIREMFHQVNIRDEDKTSQRFLWRGMDRVQEPGVMEMQVMTFGSTCSPCSAQYIRNLNASEFRDEYADAFLAITERHYVDDYLDSSRTEEDAVKLIRDVIAVHGRGGFVICGWICTSPIVLNTIPPELRAKNVTEVPLGSELQMECVLGLHWNTQDDVFIFKLKFNKIDPALLSGTKRPTKCLQVVMSVYDPLGFLSQLLVWAKILLQDVWRAEIG